MNTIKLHYKQDILKIAKIFFCSILLACSSHVTIAFFPIPFTLQTMAIVFFILYDKDIAFYACSLYIILGLLKLPMFTTNALGSYGYIIGFLLGVTIIKFYLNNNNKIIAIIIFYISTFTCGIFYLSAFFPIKDAIYLGGVAFIIPEIMKLLLVYQLTKLTKKLYETKK